MIRVLALDIVNPRHHTLEQLGSFNFADAKNIIDSWWRGGAEQKFSQRASDCKGAVLRPFRDALWPGSGNRRKVGLI